MTRRRRVATCEDCGGAPVRRGGRKWCAECYALMRRPKKTCSACSGVFAADLLQGKRCRPCVGKATHEKYVGKVYSLPPGAYDQILAAQGGACAICLRIPRAKRLATDHAHSCCPGPVSCGRCVRGLLCRSCNRFVLGHLRDSVEALQRAIDYLTLPPAKRLWPDRDVTSEQGDS